MLLIGLFCVHPYYVLNDQSDKTDIIFQMSSQNRNTSMSNPLYETSKWDQVEEAKNTGYQKTRIQRMYQYPAIIKEAQMHKKANQFGYNSKTMKDGRVAPLCPCCELAINTVRIKMKYGTTPSKDDVKAGSNIFLLNAGSAMFFTFIKMTIAYLLMRFLLSDCYNLITNTVSTTCDQGSNVQLCKNNVVAKFSSYNKNTPADEAYLYVVDILNLVTIVCSIAFFLYYRRQQYETYQLADISSVSQSDFTIFVENIPYFLPFDARASINKECLYEEALKNIFEKEAREWVQNIKNTQGVSNRLDASFYKLIQARPEIVRDPIVRSVSLCFDLTEMEKLNSIRAGLMAEHNTNVDKGVEGDESSVFYIPNQIESINSEYIELSKKFSLDSSMAFNLSHFVGKAFVSFQYEHYKEFFLEYFKDTDRLKLSDRTLKLGSAAEPSDVYWFNMKISSGDRLYSILYSGVIMVMSLVFSFALLFLLEYYQSSNTSPESPDESISDVILSYVYTIGMTVLTTIINFILAAVCKKLTEWEKHKTKTDYIVSLMMKSVLSQFFNTAFIYYIIAVVSHATHPQTSSPLSENGLVTKVTSLVAVSGAIQVALNAAQIGTLLSCILAKFQLKGDTANMFQVELNQKMQDPEFDFADRYSYYIVNVYVISFFSYITPYVSIILVLIFTIQYWIDKYNLFQRFSCPTDFDFRLSRKVLYAFETSVLIFALGNYVFSLVIHPTKDETEYHIINLVALILALVYSLAIYLLPKSWFERIDSESCETASYSQCLQNERFNKVYWLANPATTFAKEYDLNDYNKFVNYGQAEKFADAKDFDRMLQALEHGSYKVETYDKHEAELVEGAFATISKEIGGLINQNGNAEPDIFGKIAKATDK